MFSFLKLLTIDNIKNSLPQVVIIVLFMVSGYLFKAYVDARDEVLKCQLSRVADFKELRDQAFARMDKAELKADSNKSQISVLKKRVRK